MLRQRYEEAIRVYVEAAGDDELKQLVSQFESLGNVADAEADAARRALEGVADAADKIARVDAFAKLKRDLVETERELQQAQAGAQALFREFDSGDTSNSGIVRLQREARKAVADLSGEAERQRLAVQRARGELQAMGIDTRSLGSAQSALRGQFANARAALSGAIGDLQRYRAESAKTANQVQRDNREAAESYGLIGRSVRGLRGVLGGLAAYLGLREAATGVFNLLQVAAASEDARRALQNLYGSQEAGNRAFDALKTLASDSGLSFQVVADQAKKLKSFGLDPLNGSLQALVNQNAAVGGSQQDLEGKVLALGQAWAKQKLQGEEILQLVERGVPVWDLLQKVTGKNVSELQKLSEQGKLGRDTIRALYEEIGQANSGAAQKGLSSLSGLFGQVSARWQDFLNRIADAGVTEYFKRQIQSLLGSTRDMGALAKRVADAIIGTIEALRRFGEQIFPVVAAVGQFTLLLLKHAEALLFVGKVYAGLQIARLVQGFTAGAAAVQAATTAATALGAASGQAAGNVGLLARGLALLPSILRVSVITVGIEASISLLRSLNGLVEERLKQNALEEQSAVTLRNIQRELVATGQQLTSVYRQYADVAIPANAEISRFTKSQAQDYQFALEQARNYYRGVAVEAKAAGDAQAESAAVERFEALGVAVESVNDRLSELAEAASKDQRLRAYVDQVVAGFDKLASKGESVRKAISGAFDNLDLSTPRGAEQAIQIFDQISARGTAAGAAVREELQKALVQVADQDLPRLKESAQAALASGTEGAKAFAEAVASINLARLGVDLEEVRTGLGKGARVAIEQFRAATQEVKTLGLTGQQQSRAIEKAFRGAFRDISNSTELQEIEKALREAANAGVIDTATFNAAVSEVQGKLKQLQQSGQQSGESIAAGADEAASSLRVVGEAAQEAAGNVESVGEAGDAAAAGVRQAESAARSFSVSLSGVSDEFIRLLQTTDALELGNRFRAQEAELRKQVEEIQTLNAEFDGLAKRRRELQERFDLVSPDTIEQLLSAEKSLEDNRKRRDESERKAAEDARRAAAEALAEARALEAQRAQAGLQEVQVVRVEVVAAEGVQNVLGSGGRISPVVANQLANAIAQPLMDVLARARQNSMRRNPRR